MGLSRAKGAVFFSVPGRRRGPGQQWPKLHGGVPAHGSSLGKAFPVIEGSMQHCNAMQCNAMQRRTSSRCEMRSLRWVHSLRSSGSCGGRWVVPSRRVLGMHSKVKGHSLLHAHFPHTGQEDMPYLAKSKLCYSWQYDHGFEARPCTRTAIVACL